MTTSEYKLHLMNNQLQKEILALEDMIALLMSVGRLTLIKKYENPSYGYYIVDAFANTTKITQKEYNIIYENYYKNRE